LIPRAPAQDQYPPCPVAITGRHAPPINHPEALEPPERALDGPDAAAHPPGDILVSGPTDGLVAGTEDEGEQHADIHGGQSRVSGDVVGELGERDDGGSSGGSSGAGAGAIDDPSSASHHGHGYGPTRRRPRHTRQTIP
jgi:hypothetical protein